MSFKRDLLNPPRKEAKLILDLLASVGSAEEAIELVFAAGQVSMEMSKVNREGFEAELKELALERITDGDRCGGFHEEDTAEKQLLRRATTVHLDMLKRAEKFNINTSKYDVTKLLHTSESGKVKVLIDATERLAIAIAKAKRRRS